MEIDHVAIAVWDIDASLSYYVDRLGFTPIHDEVLPATGVRLAYLGDGNAVLQLVQPIAPCPVADYLEAQGEGLHHLCLAVDDVAATLPAFPNQEDVAIVRGGRGRRTCFLNAPPNGLRIELTEKEPIADDASLSAK